MNTKNLLKKLINIESISGNEREMGQFIFDLLENNGFVAEKVKVDKDRFNVTARVGEPKIFLAAHMDTVAPFIRASEKEGKIYGRGACDTKASVACIMETAIKARAMGLSDFGLVFTVGEEKDMCGVKTLVKRINFKNKFVIVGEPTKLKPINSIYGIMVLKVRVKGKAVHSSQPQLGVNAIDKLLKVISRMKQIEIFEESSCSLVEISGGIASNVIPDKAEATFSIRLSPRDKINYFEEFKKEAEGEVEIEKTLDISPTYSQIPESLKFLGDGAEVKGCTELNYFGAGVVIGPGDMNMAHSEGEYVEISELDRAVELYVEIIKKFGEK